MEREQINNKIISIDCILKITEYLETERAHYKKLYMYDKKLNYYRANKIHIFDGCDNFVKYEIDLINGENLIKEDYNWFKNQLYTLDKSNIKRIIITFKTASFSDQKNNNELMFDSKSKTIYVYFDFSENNASLSIEGNEMEEEIYKYHSDLLKILQECPDRYDKTIKHKFIRSECLSLVIGFIFAYITIICLFIFSSKLPDSLENVLNSNKYSYIIIFYAISIGLGNIIGQTISLTLYKSILPDKKYSHYSKSNHKSVYVDDISEYLKHNEVQIGKYRNSISQRAKIEKIFKITSIIVIVQIIISIIYCLIIK